MKTDQFFIPFLNFPLKEIITNWIDELLGRAAAIEVQHEETNKSLSDSNTCLQMILDRLDTVLP